MCHGKFEIMGKIVKWRSYGMNIIVKNHRAFWLIVVMVAIVFALAVPKNISAEDPIMVSGYVRDNLGSPFEDAEVQIIDPITHEIILSTLTDDFGYYELYIPQGTYDVKVIPPPESGFGSAIAPNQVLTSDTTLNFVLVPAGAAALSGKVLDPLGEGIPGQVVQLAAAGTDNWMTSITDDSGNYFFEVAPGDYDLQVYGYNYYTIPPVNAAHIYYLYGTESLSFTESITMDIPLPEHRVSVHVQDQAGNPVANVGITTSLVWNNELPLGTLPSYGCSYYPYNRPPVTTDDSGDVDLWLFTTPSSGETYTLTADPPPDSPFVTFNVFDVVVVSDQTIVIVLEFVHPPPVTTVSLSPEPDEHGVYPGPVTVTLSATAWEGYTVDGTYYCVDDGPIQTYTEPFVVSEDGTHTVEFWSVDNVGVYEIPNMLTIEILSNQPPVANANGPYISIEGTEITFDASSSSDPDDDELQFRWDLDGDGTWDTDWSDSPYAPYTWGDDYSGTVIVEVTDGKLNDIAETTVTVNNVAPSVDAGGGLAGDTWEPIQFSGSFTDPGWLDTHDIEWNFGDGHIVIGILDPTHEYEEAGDYTVTLTVTDDDGGIGTDTLSVTVFEFDWHPPMKDKRTFKAGRTIPIKFSLFRYGQFIRDESVQVTVTDSDGNIVIHAVYGNGDDHVRIDDNDKYYITNWHTDKEMRGEYTITVTFGSGLRVDKTIELVGK